MRTYRVEWEELHQWRTADQRDGRRQARLRRHGRLSRHLQRRGLRRRRQAQPVHPSVLSGSTRGSGNGIVVPSGSPVQSLAELKAPDHLRTVRLHRPWHAAARGGGARLGPAARRDHHRPVAGNRRFGLAGEPKIAAHADFVPFAELFPIAASPARSTTVPSANAPTFHGALVDAAYAERYPEVVVAYLRASIEANRLLAAEPEKYSELIEKVTPASRPRSITCSSGPLGLRTRDQA